MSGELIHYDAMCHAIEVAYRVDEIKDLRDMARAREAAAKIAGNTEAEDRCYEIRRRAERRLGQLIDEQKRMGGLSKGGGDHRVGPGPGALPTLAEVGIDKHLAHDARTLAAVPEEQFIAAFAEGGRPSVAEIANKRPPQRSHDSSVALWVWGRMRDFDREGVLRTAPTKALAEMQDHQIEDINEQMPAVIDWLSQLLALSRKRGTQ